MAFERATPILYIAALRTSTLLAIGRLGSDAAPHLHLLHLPRHHPRRLLHLLTISLPSPHHHPHRHHHRPRHTAPVTAAVAATFATTSIPTIATTFTTALTATRTLPHACRCSIYTVA